MIDQHKTLAEKFLKKGFWLYLFSFIIAPIGYFVKIIISHDLEVGEIGIIYGIMSLMTLLSSINDLGMTESLNKFLPQYITEKKYSKAKSILIYAAFSQWISGLIIFLCFFFGSKIIGTHYFGSQESINVIQIFAFYFLAINLFQVIQTFFQATQNTFMQKLVEFVRLFIVLASTFVLFIFDLGNIQTYSYTWIIGVYLGLIFSFIIFYFKYYKNNFKGEKFLTDIKLIKKIFKYAIYTFLAAQASTILSQIDMQMIIYMLGNIDAGYYTNYLSIVSIPFMLVGPITGLLFPVFSELYAKKENSKIILIKEIFQKFFVSFTIVFSILFFIFGENIATILFGEKFTESGVILKYSILFISFNFLLQLNFNILATLGKVKERFKIILYGILLNFITNIIFIKFIGVSGAALATGIGWLFIWILTEIKLTDYRVSIDYKYYLKNILYFGIIGFLLNYFIVGILNDIGNRFYELIVFSFIGLIYLLIYLFINKTDFKYFAGEIKKVRNK